MSIQLRNNEHAPKKLASVTRWLRAGLCLVLWLHVPPCYATCNLILLSPRHKRWGWMIEESIISIQHWVFKRVTKNALETLMFHMTHTQFLMEFLYCLVFLFSQICSFLHWAFYQKKENGHGFSDEIPWECCDDIEKCPLIYPLTIDLEDMSPHLYKRE